MSLNYVTFRQVLKCLHVCVKLVIILADCHNHFKRNASFLNFFQKHQQIFTTYPVQNNCVSEQLSWQKLAQPSAPRRRAPPEAPRIWPGFRGSIPLSAEEICEAWQFSRCFFKISPSNRPRGGKKKVQHSRVSGAALSASRGRSPRSGSRRRPAALSCLSIFHIVR